MTGLRRAALLAVGGWVPMSWLFATGTAMAFPSVGPGGVAPTPVAPTTVVVGDVAEGWYAPSVIDLCATPLGCLPQLLPSLYPPNTLHVGVALGQETAQAYLKPDLSALPPGARVLHATMTLPLATGNAAGNASPASATAIACLATASFTNGAAGAPGTLPATSCHGSAKLTYDAKRNVFTVDLASFFSAWAKGTSENGIALLADPSKASLSALWHFAFNGRELAGVPHISTSVSFMPPPPASQAANGDEPSPSPTPSATAPAASAAPELPLPPGESTTGVVAPAPVIAPDQPTAMPVALSRGFKYPMAYLFPIALLAVGVFMVRLFTRDATPRRRKKGTR